MSTLKVDTVRPVTTDGSLTLQGDSSGAGVTGITIDSNGVPDFPNGLTLNSSTTLDGVASTSEINGTHTTGSVTSGTTALTVASGTGISNGDYIVGRGITPGTTVSSGGGTTSIILSANANATLSSDPVSFYPATKVLTAGNIAGMLCRAWVNFNGTGTIGIRASGNVSSITDNGAGDYTVNFTNAMPDANYSAVVDHNGNGHLNSSWMAHAVFASAHSTTVAPSTSGFRFCTFHPGNLTNQDCTYNTVSVIR